MRARGRGVCRGGGRHAAVHHRSERSVGAGRRAARGRERDRCGRSAPPVARHSGPRTAAEQVGTCQEGFWEEVAVGLSVEWVSSQPSGDGGSGGKALPGKGLEVGWVGRAARSGGRSAWGPARVANRVGLGDAFWAEGPRRVKEGSVWDAQSRGKCGPWRAEWPPQGLQGKAGL